jgi:hypothetical protein
MLRESFEILIEYHLLTLWLAYDTSVVLAAVKTSTPLLIIIMILAFLSYLLLLAALFRYIVAHPNDDMGIFGMANSGIYRVTIGF